MTMPSLRAMIRGLAAASLVLLASAAQATQPTGVLTLGPADSPNVLVVHSTNSLDVFRPVLEDFARVHPTVGVEYAEWSAQELYDQAVANGADQSRKAGPDLIISSAMDLQTKLANDGLAQPHASPEARALPQGANWRDEVFGVDTDAVVMVYNTRKLDASRVPRTRRALLSLLQAADRPLAGRVATYDVTASASGYLAATQDMRLDSMAAALVAALGHNNVSLYASSDEGLDRLARGDVSLAYNMLESYTRHRIDEGAPLAIVYPQDYTLTLSRAALIPRQAPRPDLGGLMLDYLLSPRGQQAQARARQSGAHPADPAQARMAGVRPLPLDVGLLVYQDAQKKRHFLDVWQAARCDASLGCEGR
ncbi:bifunctional protein two-component system sensor protein and solute-binding protein [Bordetella ansorpii]|uniref:Bifunctional protein two-component system sensor protein and solute-binding protein n=1 Tax=Bordetella ansorpii TaxID=288768 RepID=A0A157NIP6_9BORD|nr:ABC transporter substrate-binding protein [Bordetella ansorpii]SAI21078.1 bifunctional protein two-component system sensor protein and solute-binding protein [Bordetella ansorpii]